MPTPDPALHTEGQTMGLKSRARHAASHTRLNHSSQITPRILQAAHMTNICEATMLVKGGGKVFKLPPREPPPHPQQAFGAYMPSFFAFLANVCLLLGLSSR